MRACLKRLLVAIYALSWFVAADVQAQQQCKEAKTTKAPFTFTCEGSCPPLFTAKAEVPGACTFVTTAKGQGAPGLFACVCKYEPPEATCKIALKKERVTEERHLEQLECQGTCPELFSKKPDPNDKKAKPDKKGECMMIADSRTGGGVEYKCICVY